MYQEFMYSYDWDDWYEKDGKVEHKKEHGQLEGYKWLGDGETLDYEGYYYDRNGMKKILDNVTVSATVINLNTPPKLDTNYTERINNDLTALGIQPEQLRDKLVALILRHTPITADLKALLDKLKEYNGAFSPVYDMAMSAQKGSNADIPLPPVLAKLMSAPIRYVNDELQEADSTYLLYKAHQDGFQALNIWLSAYNTRWARPEYGGGIIRFYISRDNLVQMVKDKLVVTTWMGLTPRVRVCGRGP